VPRLALEECGRCHDRNGAKGAEAQQITIAGNDYICLCFNRALKNPIIIWIDGYFDMNLGTNLV